MSTADITATHSSVGPGWGATWETDWTIPGSRPKGHISVRYVRFLLTLHLLSEGTRDNCPTLKMSQHLPDQKCLFSSLLKKQSPSLSPAPLHNQISRWRGCAELLSPCHRHNLWAPLTKRRMFLSSPKEHAKEGCSKWHLQNSVFTSLNSKQFTKQQKQPGSEAYYNALLESFPILSC